MKWVRPKNRNQFFVLQACWAAVFYTVAMAKAKFDLRALPYLATGGGISSYTRVGDAAQSLELCLDQAMRDIPKSRHRITPVSLAATAGMRLLKWALRLVGWYECTGRNWFPLQIVTCRDNAPVCCVFMCLYVFLLTPLRRCQIWQPSPICQGSTLKLYNSRDERHRYLKNGLNKLGHLYHLQFQHNFVYFHNLDINKVLQIQNAG